MYHLAKLGVNDVALFEKGDLTSGATWHAAGLVTYFNGGNNYRFWHQRSTDLFKKWQNEDGYQLSFHTPGSIRLFSKKRHVDEHLHQMGKHALYRDLFGGPDFAWVSPKEIREMHPLVNIDDTYCGFATFKDGHIDPSSTTRAYAAEAKKLGAKVFTNSQVSKISQKQDGKWELDVGGTIVVADQVVNAGGLSGGAVGEMAGVYTPCTVLQHQYVITEPIPELREIRKTRKTQLPVLRDMQGSYYLRDEGDGCILVGPYEQMSDVKITEPSLPMNEAFFLYQPDIHRLMPHLERAMERVPVISKIGIKTVLNGPTCWAPDGGPLVGPVPGKKGFWQACAESYGIAHSAGLGDYLSHWMYYGDVKYELFEADPMRYSQKWTTRSFIKEKVMETYGRNNWVSHPNESRPAGRPVAGAQDGIVALLKSRGCQFNFTSGWESPIWFSKSKDDVHSKYESFRRPKYHDTVHEEVLNLMSNCGVCYLPFSKFMLKGKDNMIALDKLVPRVLPKPGKCGLAQFISINGRVWTEMMLIRLSEDEMYIVGYSDKELYDYRWLTDHGVQVTNVTDQTAILLFNGPRSFEVLQKLGSADCSNMPGFSMVQSTIAGKACKLLTVSFIGEAGVEIHVDMKDAADVYQALIKEGACDWGTAAMNSFRLEKGIRLVGKDVTRDHFIWETDSVEKFIKLDSKDFVGKASIMKAVENKYAGSRMSVLMDVDVGSDEVDCVGNEPLRETEGGKVIGFTTSGGYTHLTDKSMAVGYIPRPADSKIDGKILYVEVLGKHYKCTLREKAPMDPYMMRKRKSGAEQAVSDLVVQLKKKH
jgi:dimethylglycine dehydrogenase